MAFGSEIAMHYGLTIWPPADLFCVNKYFTISIFL
jgi:hypothetical protein